MDAVTPPAAPASAAWAGELPTVAGLWPGATRRLTRRPGGRDGLLLLPSRRKPRMLVPVGVPAAHVMFARHTSGGLHRAGQEALARAQRLGVLRWLPLWRLEVAAGGATVEDVVRAHVPGAAGVGVLLGPPRANAKPVLQVFDGRGATVAFGKVGAPGLTAELVTNESAVLAAFAERPFAGLDVPALLHAGPWGGLELLLMSALPSAQQRTSSWEVPLEAMWEVAEHEGVQAPSTAATAGYLERLDARVAACGDDALARTWAARRDALAGVPLVTGRWHGDWAPWNMGRLGVAGAPRRPQVWDWERSETGVPVGFDPVHFVLQHRFALASTAPDALDAVLREARLDRWYDAGTQGGERAAEQVEATVALYLVEMLARYLGDGGRSRTPALARRIAVLETMSTLLTDETRRRRADA